MPRKRHDSCADGHDGLLYWPVSEEPKLPHFKLEPTKHFFVEKYFISSDIMMILDLLKSTAFKLVFFSHFNAYTHRKICIPIILCSALAITIAPHKWTFVSSKKILYFTLWFFSV